MELHIQTVQTNLDAFQIYKKLAETNSIFLDSSKPDLPYSQYSIIGVNPFLSVKYEHHCIYEKWGNGPFMAQESGSDIFGYLNETLAKYKVQNPTTLPYIGGAIGYFSYDFGCELEHIQITSEQLAPVPEAYFIFYDNAIVVDHSSDDVTITSLGILEDAKHSVDTLIHRIKATHPLDDLSTTSSSPEQIPIFHSPFSPMEYQDTIEQVRNYIREGDIYIANLTHTFSSAFFSDSLKTYEQLRQVNPAPFSAYMPFDGFEVLCSSPERFLSVRNGQVQTRPIKGTIPRGTTPEEDARNQQWLANSEKDKSELLMIVDLERNDLSKVCVPGTVKVPELFHIEAFATVFHLVSTVVGTLQDSCTAVDCLRATFPGGSITGAPKIRAMEIIDELEQNRRGLYTGSIGYFGFDGSADFNIIIRSILVKDQFAHLGVGGGITWESDARAEYEETIAKAIALFQGLNADYSK